MLESPIKQYIMLNSRDFSIFNVGRFYRCGTWETTSSFPSFHAIMKGEKKMYCTIYNDGSNYIAYEKQSKIQKKLFKKINAKEEFNEAEQLFEKLYLEAVKKGLSYKKQQEYVRVEMLKTVHIVDVAEKIVEEGFKRKLANIAARKKLFRRKAYLNKWNYFVTFTYDNEKHTDESFKQTLRKCLSNLSSRKGWKVMGIWEYGEENERLHFHALLYVPEGQMVGSLYEKKDYSKRKHKMVITHPCTFFEKRFGRCDFESINSVALKKGKYLDYILKYITKTDEKIVYSRGIPSCFKDEISEDEICAEFENFVKKFVLFDDIYDENNSRVLKSFDFGYDIDEITGEIRTE